MNYEDFKRELQENMQDNFLNQIEFLSETVNLTNQTLERVAIRFAGENTAPVIYPQKLYENYKRGFSVREIADEVSVAIAQAMLNQPQIPEFTVENAQKCITFSLMNKERNKELLEKCPYIDVCDMAAAARWHMPDEESFLVNYEILAKLQLTKEELMEIAKKNTENGKFTCKEMTASMREIMLKNGFSQEMINEAIPMLQTPFYIITNENCFDGSYAVLSDTFMKKAADQLGCEELYLLPSSRHEMLVANPELPLDPQRLKEIVVEVNSNSKVISAEDFLSDSIYKYNVKTHTLSICDSRGLFHEKGMKKGSEKKDSGRGRKM